MNAHEQHWAAAYINRTPPIAYDRNGEGPDAYHCWSFVRYIWKQHFGFDVPAVECPENHKKKWWLLEHHEERLSWEQVSVPREGDAVLLSARRYPTHVGVWLEVDGGGVLHVQEGSGLNFQSLTSLALHGWKIFGYYRHL